MRVFFHWLLLPVLGLAACDSNDDDGGSGGANNAPGSGSITVTGDINRSFTGMASFLVLTDDDGETSWGVMLMNSTPTGSGSNDVTESVVLNATGGAPATGTYALSSDGQTQVGGMYTANDGTTRSPASSPSPSPAPAASGASSSSPRRLSTRPIPRIRRRSTSR